MPVVHKMVKHPLKILQHLLQRFSRVFDQFVDTRHYRVKLFIESGNDVLQTSFLYKKRLIMRISMIPLTKFVFPKIN